VVEVARKTHGVYIGSEVFEAFTEYASKQYPLKSCEVWEKALTEYMETHPRESVNITIQQRIKAELPNRMDLLRMSMIEAKLRALIEKTGCGEVDQNWLKEAIGKETKKGLKIKKPTENFISLLEEAVKHI